MNRSLDIRSQLASMAYNQHGRASIPTLDVTDDFGEETLVECGCRAHHGLPARRISHEILVSRY